MFKWVWVLNIYFCDSFWRSALTLDKTTSLFLAEAFLFLFCIENGWLWLHSNVAMLPYFKHKQYLWLVIFIMLHFIVVRWGGFCDFASRWASASLWLDYAYILVEAFLFLFCTENGRLWLHFNVAILPYIKHKYSDLLFFIILHFIVAHWGDFCDYASGGLCLIMTRLLLFFNFELLLFHFSSDNIIFIVAFCYCYI